MASGCIAWLLFVSVYDFRQRRVPNWLVLAGAAVALAALAFRAQPFGIAWNSALLGAGVGFAFLLFFYVIRLMGAGDVKFAAALGLWVGLSALAQIWIVASLVAAAHSLLWLALRRWPVAPRLALILSGPESASAADNGAPPNRARFIPYAAYLSLAALAWMAWGRQS
jgi:prepilin peptidase CpaA